MNVLITSVGPRSVYYNSRITIRMLANRLNLATNGTEYSFRILVTESREAEILVLGTGFGPVSCYVHVDLMLNER
jgi:hypothetical protein